MNPTRRGHPRLAFLAKRSFSLHGAAVAFRRSLSRPKALHFLERQPKCVVEACGSYRGREKLGHECCRRSASSVNDAADAGAEAASRPTFVAVKTGERQGWQARSLAAADGASRSRSSALQLRRALPTSGSLRCWRLPPCAPLKQGLNEKIAERQGEGRRGLEAEHARSRDRFGGLRAGELGARLRGLARFNAERRRHGRQGEARHGSA